MYKNHVIRYDSQTKGTQAGRYESMISPAENEPLWYDKPHFLRHMPVATPPSGENYTVVKPRINRYGFLLASFLREVFGEILTPARTSKPKSCHHVNYNSRNFDDGWFCRGSVMPAEFWIRFIDVFENFRHPSRDSGQDYTNLTRFCFSFSVRFGFWVV